MKQLQFDPKNIILEGIKKNGGFVNAHAHIDRAFTITPELFLKANAQRREKWALNAEVRRTSTVSQIYDRMTRATDLLASQGVTVIGSFIDLGPDIKDKAIQAAQKVRDAYRNQIIFKFINFLPSGGIFTKEGRQWFDTGVEFADIIGGILASEKGRENDYLDIVLGIAKQKNKMVHMHVDEENTPEEKETEMLARKTIEHGMQGKVVGIHGISLNAQPKEYRDKVYQLMLKAKLMIVSNPIAWLNARRNELLAPIHNPIAPIDEMVPLGIPIGIGVDNIADIFMPFNDGNVWNDLRALMEENRLYNIDEIVKIATVNGRKTLGVNQI